MKRCGGHKISLLGDKLLVSIDCLEVKKRVVSKSVVPGKLTALQWKATHPKIFGEQNWPWWAKNRAEHWMDREEV